jgi:predicted acetyltransferase
MGSPRSFNGRSSTLRAQAKCTIWLWSRQLLVTCDEDNIGSKKIIEHNGGIFENAIEIEGDPVKKLRYWIVIQRSTKIAQ